MTKTLVPSPPVCGNSYQVIVLPSVVPSDVSQSDFQLSFPRKVSAVFQKNQSVKKLVPPLSARVMEIIVHEIGVDCHYHAFLLERFVDDSRVFFASDTQILRSVDVRLGAEHRPQFSAAFVQKNSLPHKPNPRCFSSSVYRTIDSPNPYDFSYG